MKTTLFIIAFLLLAITNSYSQDTLRITCNTKLNHSQKNGLSIEQSDYTLYLVEGKQQFFYSIYGTKAMNKINVKKQTDKYIIGTNNYDNYVYYNKAKKQLYVIDYFMSRYLIYAYGLDYSSLKETSIQMMQRFKLGKTQKDVIAFLISQADYDF